ncbi:MAG: hypothetical protein U0Y68_08340 [Blastocatellia bacterium]
MATQKGSFSEEASAMGQRATGAVKEATGAMTGNRDLEQRGEYQNQQGRARQESNQWLTGTFSDRDSAERAYNSMLNRGYNRDDVNLMMSDDTRKKYFSDDDTALGSKAMEGAGTGGAIGGIAGGIIGALAAIGTNAIVPGLGIVVAGPILAGLAGAGAGGATGGIIGALIGAGIPEDRAKAYESDIKNGGIVMGVNPRTDEDASYFEREWQGYNGRNIQR